MPKKLTNWQFQQKVIETYGDTYNFLSPYINFQTNTDLYCKKHNISFSRKPSTLLYDKYGCPECTKEIKKENLNKKTHEQFIKEAIEIHGNKYNYLTKYNGSHEEIDIECKEHRVFRQRPYAHLNGQGCPECGYKKRKLPNCKTTEQFIAEAKNKWKDKYNYSLTNYKNKYTKIKFECEKHGIIEQFPYLHLKSGCSFCNGRGISRHNHVSFVNIANQVHNNKYIYKTNFIRMSDDITITCLKHGDFIQRAGNHIHLKNGCPRCVYEARSSKAEKDIIEFVKKNYDKEILPNERILDGKEIDVYLPELMLGIEYHGCWFHLETVRGKKHHYLKWKIAKSKGIRLIQIYSNEWEEKPEIIKSKIMNLLGKSEKIHARKTKIVELNILKKDEFLTKNHLQGSDGSKICYGLEYNGELVACMTFGASRFNKNFDFELVRFCCKNYSSVIGGASKLLNYFRKRYKGSIVTYADKRYSEGGMYRKIGFTLDGETKPSFMYFNIKNNKLYNRMKFQKKKLKEMPFYDEKLTEYEIMQLNGFDRIWDAGQYRFILSEI